MAVRLNRVELLPASVDEDLAWALNEVVTRRAMTQTEALRHLNDRFAAKGIAPISLSGFNRTVLDCRERGIPVRWRPAKGSAGTPPTAEMLIPAALLTVIIEVIDQRIDAALRRREGGK